MPERPEEIFARLMPGYNLAQAKRTPRGNPYVEEAAEFEPGTYGQRSEGRPLVRLSPKAKPWERLHELEHVDQLYSPGGMEALDQGYDEPRLTSMYQSYGLTPDEASGLAYGMRPSEVAARKAAGDPGQAFQELLARVQALKARRLTSPGQPVRKPSGGLGDPSRRR